MELTKEVIETLKGKKILIITKSGFTYKGKILSYGKDYIKFLDKYNTTRFIILKEINIIEEVGDNE